MSDGLSVFENYLFAWAARLSSSGSFCYCRLLAIRCQAIRSSTDMGQTFE